MAPTSWDSSRPITPQMQRRAGSQCQCGGWEGICRAAGGEGARGNFLQEGGSRGAGRVWGRRVAVGPEAGSVSPGCLISAALYRWGVGGTEPHKSPGAMDRQMDRSEIRR